jgi:hypothetical protein
MGQPLLLVGAVVVAAVVTRLALQERSQEMAGQDETFPHSSEPWLEQLGCLRAVVAEVAMVGPAIPVLVALAELAVVALAG